MIDKRTKFSQVVLKIPNRILRPCIEWDERFHKELSKENWERTNLVKSETLAYGYDKRKAMWCSRDLTDINKDTLGGGISKLIPGWRNTTV